jgi:pyroglutamyl-peptidase
MPSSSPQTILVTGFGPFPGVSDNASAMLAVRLGEAARRRFRSRRIVAAVLPTEWEAAPERLADLYRRERPSVAVHFGVSERARGFVVETVARNRRDDRPDARAALPTHRELVNGSPDRLEVGLPAEAIRRRLARLGVPVALSADAGGYLCNAILYQSLCLAAAAAHPTIAGFIHIPVRIAAPLRDGSRADPAPPLHWDQALRGGIEILRACLGLPELRRRG